MQRNRRIFGAVDREELLAAMGECRRACIKAQSNAEIGGPAYQASAALMDAIDAAAGKLTGNREHFWMKVTVSSLVIKPGE